MALSEASVEDIQRETVDKDATAMGDTRSTFTRFQLVSNLHLQCTDPLNRSHAPRTPPPKTSHVFGSHTFLLDVKNLTRFYFLFCELFFLGK